MPYYHTNPNSMIREWKTSAWNRTLKQYEQTFIDTDTECCRRICHEYAIVQVVFNDPATIVFWNDGTKTVVKCAPGDVFSKELGLAMAIMKKVYGNDNSFHKEFKRWIGDA